MGEEGGRDPRDLPRRAEVSGVLNIFASLCFADGAQGITSKRPLDRLGVVPSEAEGRMRELTDPEDTQSFFPWSAARRGGNSRIRET